MPVLSFTPVVVNLFGIDSHFLIC